MQPFRRHSNEVQIPRSRLIIMSLIAVIIFGILISRMYYLQVIEHEKHRAVANRNRIDIRPIKPKRGLIFDRNNILIADNQPSFSLTLTPENIVDLERTKKVLTESLDLSPTQTQMLGKLNSIPRRPFEPLTLKDRLTAEEIAAVVVNQHTLPGVDIKGDLRRRYPYAEQTAHLLGFVGQISEEERSSLKKERQGITHTGKKGLELTYEQTLSGVPGHKYIETNAKGRFLRTLETHAPAAGVDLQLTIDIGLQQALYKHLAQFKRAAAVIIEPGTGAILAMASVPSYDPNLFVSGLSHNDYRELHNNSLRPLFNRAVQGQYPPGSTIKPMVGLAGIALGLADWQTQIWDPGFYQLDNHPIRYRDWKRYGHGYVNLERAIVESCDTYFYDLGKRIAIDDLREYMLAFSLGAPTGIDLTGEAPGLFPSSQWKRLNFKQPWFPGETLIATIGQGYVLSTPLQLAHATAILANRGYSAAPHLVNKTRPRANQAKWIPSTPINDQNPGPKLLQANAHHLDNPWHFNNPNWQKMIDAMASVVTAKKGTARKISNNLDYTIAGKTGTAQVVAIAQNEFYDPDSLSEEHLDHALFVGFAPVESPEIAVAIIIENGGSGGSVAAPVARDIFDAFFSQKNLENKTLENNKKKAAL